MIASYSYPVEKIPIIEKFEEITRREGKKMSPVIVQLIVDFVKIHGDGNPNSSLDQFEQTDFKVTPALFRNKQAWQTYYKKLTKTEYKEIDQQLNLLLNIHNQNIQ